MAGNSLQQANHFPGDAIPPIPLEPHNYAPQNARVLPAPQNGHSVGHWEDIHQPGGVADPGRPQDPHHNFDHYVIADYHRRMLHEPADPYPILELAQGVQGQGQANAPDHGHFGYVVPQHVAPGIAQAASPHPFLHRVPTPVQQREDNLRRLAGRYLYHPDSQVNMVWMEPGAAGRFNVVIIIDASDVL